MAPYTTIHKCSICGRSFTDDQLDESDKSIFVCYECKIKDLKDKKITIRRLYDFPAIIIGTLILLFGLYLDLNIFMISILLNTDSTMALIISVTITIIGLWILFKFSHKDVET